MAPTPATAITAASTRHMRPLPINVEPIVRPIMASAIPREATVRKGL